MNRDERRPTRVKEVLTTGEVARICNVAPRTVSKWFDTGRLRGYRIPGSKDRRIPLQQLIRFMKAHNIPLQGLDTGLTRVLLAERDGQLAETLSESLKERAGYEVSVARSAFEAGVKAEAVRPQVMLLDVEIPGLSSRDDLRVMRGLSDLAGSRIIALTGPLREGDAESLRAQGFDDVLPKPFEIDQVLTLIERDNCPGEGAAE